MRAFQRIQNKGARFITNTRLIEGKTNEEVNRKAQLEPLNQSLYSRARKTWNQIRLEQREEWAKVVTHGISRKKNWPKSIPVVFNGEPPPIFG